MAITKIEWTEATWNPVSGCTKISEGCKNCYAETMANRLKAMGTKGYEDGFEVTLHIERMDEPLRRKKPTMYFVCSMGDLFHEDVDFDDIDNIFFVMSMCPQHTFQVLTKRPERMKEFLSDAKDTINTSRKICELPPVEVPLSNVWLGVTAENQEQADKRIPILLDIPAAVRFVSIEPMLGEIDLKLWQSEGNPTNQEPLRERNWLIDWVIVGGETGAGARPIRYEWVKSIQSQCEEFGVPFFFKKWGKIAYHKGDAMTNTKLFDGIIDGLKCRQMPKQGAKNA